MSQGPSFPHFLTNHENSTKRLMQEAEKCQEKQKRERERVHGSCMKRLQPLDAPPLESSPWGLAMRLLEALLLLWVPGEQGWAWMWGGPCWLVRCEARAVIGKKN